MNATAKTFLVAVFAVASAAVSALMLAGAANDAPKQEVVKLERVVVVGKRLAPVPQQLAQIERIEQLPRVVIEGRRQAKATDSQLAQARCEAVTRC